MSHCINLSLHKMSHQLLACELSLGRRARVGLTLTLPCPRGKDRVGTARLVVYLLRGTDWSVGFCASGAGVGAHGGPALTLTSAGGRTRGYYGGLEGQDVGSVWITCCCSARCGQDRVSLKAGTCRLSVRMQTRLWGGHSACPGFLVYP